MVKAKYFFDLYKILLSKFNKGEYDEVIQGIEKTKSITYNSGHGTQLSGILTLPARK